MAVNENGYREVLCATKDMKENYASCSSFFRRFRSRRLNGIKLIAQESKKLSEQRPML